MSSNPATVLITGASGFLGGRLTQILVERGERVRVLARGSSDLRHLSHIKIQIVRGDLCDAAALEEAVRGARVIYHCAACSTDWAAPTTYREANVTGTQKLLDAAVRAGSVERFLHVSTTDVYGYPATPCNESAPLRDVGLPYNRTKIQGEEAVWRAHREHGLPVTVLRPATIYGPRSKDFVLEIATLLRQRLMLLIKNRQANGQTDGSAPGGFTYVDDVAQAMIDAAASARTQGRAYNICGEWGTTWRAYTGGLADALGCGHPWLSLPFPAARALGRVMEMPYGWLHLKHRPLLTRHAAYLLGRSQEFPAARARADFGFMPQVPLAEGLRRSAEWIQSLAQ